MEREERCGDRVIVEIDSLECQVAKRLRGELMPKKKNKEREKEREIERGGREII